jgi:hypothetical protein
MYVHDLYQKGMSCLVISSRVFSLDLKDKDVLINLTIPLDTIAKPISSKHWKIILF